MNAVLFVFLLECYISYIIHYLNVILLIQNDKGLLELTSAVFGKYTLSRLHVHLKACSFFGFWLLDMHLYFFNETGLFPLL